MSDTRKLASYLSKIKFEDLPSGAVEKAKLQILDSVGNCIGAYPLSLSKTFVEMAKDLGSGKNEATIICDGTKVSIPFAAFANESLAHNLDYVAGGGSLAVPAALAAGDAKDISGKDLIASVVAGYECLSRIGASMDSNLPQDRLLNGGTTWAFASAGAAGRALSLDEDEMLSTIGMTGIYTSVPAGYKWLGDEGLLPRKDIKQGWGWICMTGAFAAVSAQSGLRMVQENNILDGDHGLWQMLGKDIFKPEELTEGFGEKYHILQFASKRWPGCMVTHPAMDGTTDLLREHGIDAEDIERIEVVTNRFMGVGFHDQEPVSMCDQQFSIPYQVSASILAGERGPNWYLEGVVADPAMASMAKRVTLSFDDECDQAVRDGKPLMTKVAIHTKSGQRHDKRIVDCEVAQSANDIKHKFRTTTSQVIDQKQADDILEAVDNLESLGNVSSLLSLLRVSV